MIQAITIPLPYKMSTNRIYAGLHWAVRKKYKDMMRWALITSIGRLKPVKEGKITFEFGFVNKPLDCSNCSFMAKMIEDVLVEHHILIDDSPKYIKEITIRSTKADRDICTLTLES